MSEYALDLTTPARYVVAELDKADGPLPLLELAMRYQHPIAGDLVRIRRHEGAITDRQAQRWLIQRVLAELGDQVVTDAAGWFQLAVPPDEARFQGRLLQAFTDEYARLGDPFSPQTGGVLSETTRLGKSNRAGVPADDELRESMRQCGWLPHFPAVTDERGTVITGRRRLKFAAELGIEPNVRTHEFGHGDAADIQRLKWAWFSNEGHRPYSAGDRQAMAAYLAGRGWTQQSIADALGAAQSTISADLAKRPAITAADNQPREQAIQQGHRSQDRGAGRPRKSGRSLSGRKSKWNDPDLLQAVRDGLRDGTWINDTARQHGVSGTTAERALAYVMGELDAADAALAACPECGHALTTAHKTGTSDRDGT